MIVDNAPELTGTAVARQMPTLVLWYILGLGFSFYSCCCGDMMYERVDSRYASYTSLVVTSCLPLLQVLNSILVNTNRAAILQSLFQYSPPIAVTKFVFNVHVVAALNLFE
jgi:hypothetical protein